MSAAIAVSLKAWSGWAPGMPDREHWQRWLAEGTGQQGSERPACKMIPPMLRRRCTMNTRMALESALTVCQEAGVDPKQVQLFHGTTNGEISSLNRLLHDLADDEPLSPTAFTNSVHHVPTGYFSIATQHMGLSRTISAFEDTFTCTFLDMLGRFARNRNQPALLIVGDELPPEPFDILLASPPIPYTVSLLFTACEPGTPSSITFSRDLNSEIVDRPHNIQPLFDFLRWVDSDEASLRLDTSFGAVVWQRH